MTDVAWATPDFLRHGVVPMPIGRYGFLMFNRCSSHRRQANASLLMLLLIVGFGIQLVLYPLAALVILGGVVTFGLAADGPRFFSKVIANVRRMR